MVIGETLSPGGFMKKRVTIEQIRNYIESYGYMLLSTTYKGYSKKLTLVCPEGHVIKLSYGSFKQGARCMICNDRRKTSQRIPYELVNNIFINRNCTLMSAEYINAKTKLIYKCNKCGIIIENSLDNFKHNKYPCKCYYNPTGQNTPHKYEYVQSCFESEGHTLLTYQYINSRQRLRYMCSNGHVNTIRFDDFKKGSRCKTCNKSKGPHNKLTYDQVKNYVESIGYTLLSHKYINSHTKIKVRCTNGHEYKVTLSSLRSGRRCKICTDKLTGIKNRHSFEHVKRHIEVSGYILLSDTYVDAKTLLDVQCPKGHEYKVRYYAFQQGSRCPHCNPGYSKAEKEVAQFVKDLIGSSLVLENDRTVLDGRELDIYIPSKNLAIEYCGLHWHSDQYINRNYHRLKYEDCKSKNIRLITIFEDEWVNKQEICKSRISHALGMSTKRIYARKCDIRTITSKVANVFYENTHLQGRTRGKLHIGLFHNDELVQAMSLGELSRKHVQSKTLEVKRMSNLIGINVIGGASKLFKYAKRYALQHEYNYIRSYCDLRWGTGGVYDTLSFEYKRETKYTPHYVLGQDRYRNQSLRKTPEERKTGKTEWELRQAQGYERIWDCGHQTWDHSLLMEQWQRLFQINISA
jgi:hypothetical protein